MLTGRERMRLLLTTSSLLLAVIAAVGADVAPYPAWRIVTDGAINGATQSGGAIYFGGNFSKVGHGVAPFEGFLDVSSLTLSAEPGCARDRDTPLDTEPDGTPRLIGRDQTPFGARLADGTGPFVVGDDVLYVRVGSDCRFDRHFGLRLPVPGRLMGSPVYIGDVLYSAVEVATLPSPDRWYVAAFDARTGDLLRGWPVPPLSELVGRGAAARLALTYPVRESLTLAIFDPATGSVTVAGSVLGNVIRLRSHALISTYAPGQRLDLYDLTTWERLPAWPNVEMDSSFGLLSAVTSTHLVLAGSGLRIDGAEARSIARFDLQTGALDRAWSAPEWVGAVRYITIAGSHLIIAGDFAPGAPRDTMAILDLSTGALDAWELPYAALWVTRAGPYLNLGQITSTRRIPRRFLAAVDAISGDVLPWDPGQRLPAGAFLPVNALVHEGPFVYASHPEEVRRFDIHSGEPDTTWQLQLHTLTPYLPVSDQAIRLALGPGVIYATGGFNQARAGGVGPFESRDGGAAITTSGALTSWNPRVAPTCLAGGRYPFLYPCIAGVAVTPDRVFVRGTLRFLDTPTQNRLIAALTTDTGALDAAFPSIETPGFASADGVLYGGTTLDGRGRLFRVDPGMRITLLPETPAGSSSFMAARNNRVYAGLEHDGDTGSPTGNRKLWVHPMSAEQGVLDIEPFGALGFFADMAATPPGRPVDLAPLISGPVVTLRWARAPGDLHPLVPVPPGGGPAPTSHLITASLTPGGATIAQLDTGSADTTHRVTAPTGVFFVRVQAKNAFGISEPSNEVRVEVRPAAPDPPVATVAAVIGREVRMQWQGAATGWPADSYVLEAGTRPGAADLAMIPVNGIEFRAFQVPPGRYYVRVRSVNGRGVSAPGQEVAVEVSP